MKTVLITGANGNLGQATTEHFLRQGWRVVALVYSNRNNPSPANKLHIYQIDLTDEAAVEKHFNDKLCNYPFQAGCFLAGGFAMGNFKDTTKAKLHEMTALNFETAFTTSRQLFLQMEKVNGGRMVFMGAKPALEPELATGTISYSLSKSLVIKLAELINVAGKEKNITATTIVPSIIDTPQNRKAMPNSKFENWVKPAQLAETIYFSCVQEGLSGSMLKVYGNIS